MSGDRQVARVVARTVLSNDWTPGAIATSVQTALGLKKSSRAIQDLVDRIIAAFGQTPPPPTLRNLTRLIERDTKFGKFLAEDEDRYISRLNLAGTGQPQMQPAPQIPSEWHLPQIVTAGELAAWFKISPQELNWFADCHGGEQQQETEVLRHYRYRWMAKRTGGQRLLEIPKPRLRNIQRQLLHDILDRVTPHESAHAFRKGRSIETFINPHCAKRVVLRVDLCNFFSSIHAGRVFGLFRTIGYPEPVARLLSGLCTNSTPAAVLEDSRQNATSSVHRQDPWQFGLPHLPQGAPTSPALANLVARRLDCRLNGLAKSVGAEYSRYADDLVFSGDRDFEQRLSRFRVFMLSIVLDEGFTIQNRKTRVMRSGGRQQVSGVVLNERPNLSRAEFDRLKAILFNCVQHGPASQAERALPSSMYRKNGEGVSDNVRQLRSHLAGKIGFARMINPTKAARLQRLFDQIDW